MSGKDENENPQGLPKSLTLKYLNEVLDEPTRKKLLTSLGFKMEVSRETGQLEDHLHTAIVRWLERKAFDKRITLGDAPKFGSLKNFTTNSAYTDARTWGRDPVCRTLFGAKTQTDFKLEGEGRSTANFQHPAPADICVEKNEDGKVIDTVVIDNSAAFNEAEFQDVWNRLEKIFERKFGDNGERNLRIMRDFGVEGYSVKEIAQRSSLEDDDVTQILSEVRRHMRRDRNKPEMQELMEYLT